MTTTKLQSPKRVTKTVVKKATAKKLAPAAKKATTKKSSAKKPLVIAPDHSSFWVTNGMILNSLPALYAALVEMQDSDYTYHVSKDGNHFADWVLVVLHDEACAEDLRKATTVKQATLVVAKHLKSYQI